MSKFDYTINNEVEAIEQGILSVLISNERMLEECELQSSDFNIPLHKRLYGALHSVYKTFGTIDTLALFKQLSDVHGIEDYILGLINSYVTSSNLHLYIEKLHETNRCIEVNRLVKQMNDGEIDFDELVSEINKTNASRKEESSANMLSATDMYELITSDESKLSFDKFKWLQHRIGFMERTVNIIAARTSVGKSAFALNLMCDLANRYKCLFINMEMTEKEVYQRMVSIESSIPIENFKKLNQEDRSKVIRGVNTVKSKKIKIYNGSKSVNGLRRILNRETRNEHCIVFVDYIGYMTTGKKQNDRERIGEAVREIQIMSKDYNCTFFVVAQINREGTDTPSLIHLKDTGELEQTGHAIVILHNPEKDLNNQMPSYEIIVAKNRSGKLGKIKFVFDKSTQKFYEENSRYG